MVYKINGFKKDVGTTFAVKVSKETAEAGTFNFGCPENIDYCYFTPQRHCGTNSFFIACGCADPLLGFCNAW